MSDVDTITSKICSHCRELLSASSFNKNKSRRFGLAPDCKECHRRHEKPKVAKKISEMTSEEVNLKRRRVREWADRNREYELERKRLYHAKNKQSQSERHKRWREENRGVANAQDARRRAAVRKRTPPWLTEDMLEQIRLVYVFAAAWTEAAGEQHHVDHIVPLQGKEVCGLHVPWNLRIISAEENHKKSNRLLAHHQLCDTLV